jgi:hypothetical protein
VEFNGISMPSTEIDARLLKTQTEVDDFTLLFARLQSAGESARLRATYWRQADGAGMPGVQLWHRVGENSSAAGNGLSLAINDSSGVGYGELSVSVPAGYDWATYGPLARWDLRAAPSSPTVAGSAFALSEYPWLEMETGAVLHSWSMSGRSIEGFLPYADGVGYDPSIWSDYVPLLGDHRMAWIDLGTNNLRSNTQAEHEAKLKELIALFRSGSPGAPVMITTAYPRETDADVTPYYVAAARNVAASVPGVLLVDTYEEMPLYSEGVALGYYLDATHYNTAGVAAWMSKISALIAVAADDLFAAAGDSLFEVHGEVGTNGSGLFRWYDDGPSAYHWDSAETEKQPSVDDGSILFDGSAYVRSTLGKAGYKWMHDGTAEPFLLTVTESQTSSVTYIAGTTYDQAASLGLLLYSTGLRQNNGQLGNGVASISVAAVLSAAPTGDVVRTLEHDGVNLTVTAYGTVGGAPETATASAALGALSASDSLREMEFGRRPGISTVYGALKAKAAILLKDPTPDQKLAVTRIMRNRYQP